MEFNKQTLIETLQSLPNIIETYFENIPDEALDKRRNESSWTIREHLYHIVSVQEMLYLRMLKIKNEENPVITPYFPENESERETLYESTTKAFVHYKEFRKKQVSLINQMTEVELKKEAKHDEYLKYNIPLIINHMIFHEYWHMYRIEELWLTKNEYFL